MPRAHCYRCDKPEVMCVCTDLTTIQNTVGIYILQHPRERRHALGTVRLLRHGLANVQVHTLDLLGDGGRSRVIELPTGAGLLYPTKDARDLATLNPDERPSHLVIIDGTWAHANRIFQDNPWLSHRPAFKLPPHGGSRYRIRPEPRHECLSTAESVIEALRCLEPQLKGTESLEVAFERMIDAQIDAFSRAEKPGRTKRVKQRKRQEIPAVLMSSKTSVFVVYAEPSPLRNQDPTTRHPMRLSAMSLDDEGCFDCFIHTDIQPDAYESEQMGLSMNELDSAHPIETVLASFREFCDNLGQGRPIILLSWGRWTYRWCSSTFPEWTCISLKKVWANVSRAPVPNLDVLVEQVGVSTKNAEISGRAGRRVSNAHAMAQYILRPATDVR